MIQESKSMFPQIMGIVNITPDSFSDGGLYYNTQKAIDHAFKLIEDGADILDIGGESTRPGAATVDATTEIARVVPIIEAIRSKNTQIKISVDTSKYEVAKVVSEFGINIINDISALNISPKIAEICADKKLELVLMHMQGNPQTMQSKPTYTNVVEEVFQFLKERIEFAKSFGLEKIYSDVGIGFGKNLEHNLDLLKNIEKFTELNVPILLGISRKSFIKQLFSIDNPIERDTVTTIIHTLLLSKPIDIIRVHNVKNFSQLKQVNQILNG